MDEKRMACVMENRQFHIQMEQIESRIMAQKELTAIQALVLLYVLDHSEQGVFLTDIQRKFHSSMAAMSELVKRLREKGYIEVRSCPGDERRKILSGSRMGKEVREFLNHEIEEMPDQIYSGFSPEELRTLDRLQKKMLRNLSALKEKYDKEVSKT